MLQEVINNSNAEVARACGRSLGESSKNLEKVVQTAEAEKDKADMAWARGLSPEEFQNERDYRIKKANSARQKAKQANSETEITEKEKAQGDWERKIEKLIRYYDGPECYHETIYPVTQRVDGQPLVCSWCGKKPDLGTLYACTLDSEPFLEDDYPRNPDKVQYVDDAISRHFAKQMGLGADGPDNNSRDLLSNVNRSSTPWPSPVHKMTSQGIICSTMGRSPIPGMTNRGFANQNTSAVTALALGFTPSHRHRRLVADVKAVKNIGLRLVQLPKDHPVTPRKIDYPPTQVLRKHESRPANT
ncbi:hypothetical protein VTJ04DRAFT_186 [Mycothermus thermophilus]|uniref:uncharacterized protein n=1 Tax=Humicola insolens TaxID=85995 RepID=UPI0037439EF7